jgi:hypothetical protein
MAKCFGWPFTDKSSFQFENANGELFGGYDAGLDYNKDGITFEWEWRIQNPMRKVD